MTTDDHNPRDGTAGSEGGDQQTVVRLPRRRDRAAGSATDPELRQVVQGSHPGSRFLRLTRFASQKLRRVGSGDFEVTRAAMEPRTPLGRVLTRVRYAIFGQPLASTALAGERLSKVKALAIFSSDNLSSSAYATEEILLVLILAGSSALHLSLPIALGIAALAAIVATSYRQLVRAYPGGGGAYVVTKENLGFSASLVTGSTLFVDYILTVAVSTAAGVAAITSALPDLHSVRVELAVLFVVLLTLGNLRGIREAGNLFAIPSYIFIFSFGGMIVWGGVRLALGHDLQPPTSDSPVLPGTEAVTGLLLLRAFASGAAALTGIEAIADGVPSFKVPEAKNAATTLTWMAAILGAFFLGTTVLAIKLDIVPSETSTVVAQVAETVFGRNGFFYLIQVATAMILVLAANTAFAGLPTLASVMARDGVMPRQFAFRGDRLAFSNGIVVLGIASSLVLVVFDAETHKLIPLYALGVFLAFTLSQAGMVIHWRKNHTPRWRLSLAINATGAIVTGIVAAIVVGTKFISGAWLSITAMVLLFLALNKIRTHYFDVSRQLGRGLTGPEQLVEHFYSISARRPQTVLVPVDGINEATLKTVAYARRLSENTTALHVTDDREKADELREEWPRFVPDVPLVVVESPYGSFVEPIIAYVEALQQQEPTRIVAVVLPEIATRRAWQRLLHNRLVHQLHDELIKHQGVVVATVPYRLGEEVST